MQDRKNRAVTLGVQEFIRMPTGGERAGLGFTIADNAANKQIGIIEGGAKGVRDRVAQFASFMNRARGLRSCVAWDASRKRKLLEQSVQTFLGLRNMRVKLAIGTLQKCIGHHPRSSVPRPSDENYIQVELFYEPIEMNINKIQAGRRPPVSEQARFDLVDFKGLA